MAEYIEREALQKRLEMHQATNPATIGTKQFQEGYYLGLSEAEIMIAQAPKADVAEVRPELRKAVKLLEENYERGLNSDYVNNPVAWALYQTWKQMDGGADNVYLGV